MAITFEEEKKNVNWLGILSIILVVGFVGTAIFYLFFSKPGVGEEFLFPKLKTIAEFKNVNFDFENALNDPGFKNLKILVNFATPSQDAIGKTNPFTQ